MALTGSGATAAQVVMAAKKVVQNKWIAKNRQLSQAEQAEMIQEMEAAGYNALFAHLVATITVAGTATGAAAGGPGVPVVGTIL